MHDLRTSRMTYLAALVSSVVRACCATRLTMSGAGCRSTRVGLALLLIGLLTACGGGGGAGGGSPAGQPPVISGKSIDYVRSGTVYSFIPAASDPDNNPLRFSIRNQPDWAAFDPDTGELSGTPVDPDIQRYDDIQITVSDGTHSVDLPPFFITVMHGAVGENNVTLAPSATVTVAVGGYNLLGDASIAVGSLVTDFKNSDLQFRYDAEGNLLDLAGSTDLPPVISDNLSLDTRVNAIVGMFTGAEINADVDIGPDSAPGILLRDEFRYLVYFLDTATNLTFHGADGIDVPISLNVGGSRTLIITDPTDPFFYYFGEIGGLAAGYGNSKNGNIPYEPLFKPTGPVAFAPLEPFMGSEIIKGTFPITAFKVLDFLEISGTAVCSPPQLLSCGKPDPASIVISTAEALLIGGGIDPSQQLTLGLNGTAAVRVKVLGVDLFQYHLLDVAAMVDIGTTNEHLALQGVIDPARSNQPAWLPIKPIPDPNALLVGNLFADLNPQNGKGDFGLSLYGNFESTFPAATISGKIDINARGLQLVGTIEDPTNPITVRATADRRALEADITFGYDFGSNSNTVVNDALDRALAEVDTLFAELQDAIGNYDLAFSLNGLRSQIPGIVDRAKGVLDGIPGKVYTSAYNGTRDGINGATYKWQRITFHASDVISANGTAASVATTAQSNAQTIVNARKVELDKLKAQAQQPQDGTAFRTALKNALLAVVNHAKVTQTVKASKTVNFKFLGKVVARPTITFYNSTLSYTVLSGSTKSTLQTAANNVDNIDPNQIIMFNTQAIFDAIPKQDVIDQARAGVQNGSIGVPTINGAGYRVTRTLDQSAYLLINNQRVDITFNPLDPAAALKGVGDVIASQLIP